MSIYVSARIWLQRSIRAAAAIAFISAAAVAGAITIPGAALADQLEDLGDGWQGYVNDRFGTRIVFPSFFTPEEAPEAGDGRRFHSEDATLEVYAWENQDGETAASLKDRLLGSQGYTNVTYSPTGRSWLVVSGFRGDNIFYEKYFFRGGEIHGFGMEFPRGAKPRYAPIVEEIEDSFRAGWN
jgi:hypothetical protein